MAERRKLAAILAADVVGFSRLAGVDEDRTLARRALRSDLIDPTISVHNGHVIKRTGDGMPPRRLRQLLGSFASVPGGDRERVLRVELTRSEFTSGTVDPRATMPFRPIQAMSGKAPF